MRVGNERRGWAEPRLAGVLAEAGLDAQYTRARGDLLYLGTEDGEIPVLDFAGGYGSLMLGHNPPEILSVVRDSLDREIPVHAQFSRQAEAERLADVLGGIVQRESGRDEPFYATFANSGAEAVEAAVKHAEFDRVLRVGALVEQVGAANAEVRERVAGGRARVDARVFDLLPEVAADPADRAAPEEELFRRVGAHNDAAAATRPRFVALEGGFHGKLGTSVQFTHNPGYRVPFQGLGPRVDFVAADRPEELKRVFAEGAVSLLELRVAEGSVELVERPLPVFAAMLVEPVQGEGGIRVLDEHEARALQDTCRSVGCPLIVDEIQSGMGRTGSFLASARIGLSGDYYVLAKALGGGVAKTSVALVREGLYREDFEMVHSSTFARDGLSTRVALRVLELLEADDGALYAAARERGERITAALEGVRADFPDVVAEVSGLGLMLGVRFHDLSDSTAEPIGELARSGLLGYGIAGHLLREHRIRTFPTASAPGTLRLEPSVYIDDDAVDRFEGALRAVCVLLREQDAPKLLGFG